MSVIRIIGIGNPDRGDDGVGSAVIAALACAPPPAAEIGTASGDVLGLIERWESPDRVFLVDAMAPDGAPGRAVRFDAGAGALTGKLASFASSHAFNLAETVELARALGRLPAALVIYGIEGVRFEPGAPLSAPVAAAVPGVVRRLEEECAACTKPR